MLAAFVQSWASHAAEPEQPAQQLDDHAQVRILAERVSRIEAVLQNQAVLNLLKEVEALKAEVSRLRGRDEVQDHNIESLGKRQGDLYVDLDKRIESLNKQAAAMKTPPQPVAVASREEPKPAAAQPAAAVVAQAQEKPAAPPPQEDPMAESRAYESALNLFRAGNYSASISEFKNFLKKFPDSTLAPNAQYWSGYAYYALKDYKNALAYQIKLVSSWPQSSKVPDALLNMANNQIELDDLESAKKNLEEIVAKFPGTNAAAIAAKKLALLK